MTLTLNKGFWSPAAGGGGNNPDFTDVQFLTNFDTNLPTDLSNNSTSVSSSSYAMETTNTMFSSNGAFEGTGQSGSGSTSIANYYLKVDSSTNFISPTTNPRTAECFFYAENIPSTTTWPNIWSNYSHGGNVGTYLSLTNPGYNQTLYLTLRGTSTIDLYATTNLISADTWYYVMVAFSGTSVASPQVSIYCAEASESTAPQVANQSYSYSVPDGSVAAIGANYASSRPSHGFFSGWDGHIDELRVSTVDLSSDHAATVPVPQTTFPTS